MYEQSVLFGRCSWPYFFLALRGIKPWNCGDTIVRCSVIKTLSLCCGHFTPHTLLFKALTVACVFLASLFSVKCESKPPPSDKGNTVGLQQMLLWYYLNSGKLLSEIRHVTLNALFCFIKAIFTQRFLMRNACMNVGEERVQSCKLVSDVLCSHQ